MVESRDVFAYWRFKTIEKEVVAYSIRGSGCTDSGQAKFWYFGKVLAYREIRFGLCLLIY